MAKARNTDFVERTYSPAVAESLGERLRDMIRDALASVMDERDLSQQHVARSTTIPQPVLCRFLNGGSIKVETAGILLDYVGLDIVEKTKIKLG
ncbi:MAG: hypothetical protein SH850_25770 [Planctomycetaceae bacterium]|nr:hypothetical protein [Planctomycetaceae bacterium]